MPGHPGDDALDTPTPRSRRSRPLWRPPWFRVEVVGTSMSPTLEPGEYLIGRRASRPVPGSIIAFESDGLTLVKRVIAVGADVEIDGGVVAVAGAPVPDPWWGGATRPDGRWEVGPDEVFVLGDRRSESRSDSRERGPVPLGELLGVITWRYWPIARAGRLSEPPTPPSADGAGRPAG